MIAPFAPFTLENRPTAQRLPERGNANSEIITTGCQLEVRMKERSKIESAWLD